MGWRSLPSAVSVPVSGEKGNSGAAENHAARKGGLQKKPRSNRGFLGDFFRGVGSGFCYFGRLRAFLTLNHFEFDLVTLCERLETRA